MVRSSSIAVCAALIAACASAPSRPSPAVASQQPARYPLRAPPPSLQAAASRADQAIERFKQRVSREYLEAVARRGPAAAVEGLHAVDPPTATDALQEPGCEVGRPSPRLRNPRNAPPAWVKPLLGNGQARPAADTGCLGTDMGFHNCACPTPRVSFSSRWLTSICHRSK